MVQEPTVGEALAAFRAANGLCDREASAAWWSCRLGPIRIWLPNFQWRKRALLAHDVHHVLTGYPCGLRGEFQMAAWEFGAGPMPHWGAALFCLPLAFIGLLVMPRRVLQAFAAGRRSRTLHNSDMVGEVLAMPLHAARASLRRD